jgi:osmoprotectant transport system permease protein
MPLTAAWQYLLEHPRLFMDALVTHLELSGAALGIALGLAVPVALGLHRRPRAAAVAINAANICRTIPGLAILAMALPIVGTGFLPSLLALVVVAVPPILINTHVGIRDVDADAVESARGMGMTDHQVLARVELPLATPLIFAGIRIAAVQVIAAASLAAFIGGGGLGDFIMSGIALMQMPLLLIGAVPIALLSIGADLLFAGAQRTLGPRGLHPR